MSKTSTTATSTTTTSATFAVPGMTCGACESHVRQAAESATGVHSALVDRATGRAVVTFDPALTTAAVIGDAITAAGYPAAPAAPGPPATGVQACACCAR